MPRKFASVPKFPTFSTNKMSITLLIFQNVVTDRSLSVAKLIIIFGIKAIIAYK